jgi:uncharacterized protein
VTRASFATHKVLNQSPPFVDVDLFALDRPLADAVAANGGACAHDELSEFPVNAIWEGSGNVTCLDVLRALSREAEAAASILQDLASETAGLPGAAETVALIGTAFRRPDCERTARMAVEKLALLAASAALNQISSRHAELFAGTRLAGNHGSMYGAVDRKTTWCGCSTAHYPHEGWLMDSLDPASPAAATAGSVQRPRRIWKFWGTALWGLAIFGAMFAGQMVVVGWFVLREQGPLDVSSATRVLGGGLTIALSVITGLPAVLGALWIAIRISGTPFADYLALRGISWRNVAIGAGALALLVVAWELLSRAVGRESTPEFMMDVLRSARADGALWVLVIAFCVAAPISEEFFARGFLYRGWSETFLRTPGAILLSSVVWTALHLQYDWFFFGEVFSIGLLLGFLRYRYQSTWLTVIVHGLNNLAAVVQTFWLVSA